MPSRWPPLVLASLQLLAAWSLPREYTVINEACPGAEWNIMCRECCEYGQVECVCPGRKEVVGYTIPCCRNEEDECDSCLIHPGCTIFENCKSCRNGSWGGTLDDFYVKGLYCAECRAGWYGGDCMRCGQVLRAPKGQILLESYPLNAHCEWTIHARAGFLVQLRVVMLSLEFDYTCQYDYIEVRDGDSSSSRVIKRFCGNERPAPLRSTGATLHVLFHSDGSKNFDGFHAIFEEVTACSSSPCLHDGTCLLDKTGSFTCACLAGYTGSRCESEERCIFLTQMQTAQRVGDSVGIVAEQSWCREPHGRRGVSVQAFLCSVQPQLSERHCPNPGSSPGGLCSIPPWDMPHCPEERWSL